MQDFYNDFREEAIKLPNEIGPTKVSDQLGIPLTTLYTYRNKVRRHGTIAL